MADGSKTVSGSYRTENSQFGCLPIFFMRFSSLFWLSLCKLDVRYGPADGHRVGDAPAGSLAVESTGQKT